MLARMKITALIVRILLGLLFTVFGSNAFLQFMPIPPMQGPAGDFIGAMNATGYLQAIAVLQVIGGLLLLIGFGPLGLLILGPIIVNIVFYHLFMEPSGMGMAAGISLMALFLLWYYRAAFAGIWKR